MSTGKDIILNYCNQFSLSSIDHMEQAIENGELIKQSKYDKLNGCPSSFGLTDHIGLCEIEETNDYTEKQKTDMCERCWRQALNG